MKKIIFYIIAIWSISCCQEYKIKRQQIRCNNHMVMAIRGGCLDTTSRTIITKDTTSPEVISKDTTQLSIDTNALYQRWKTDSCFSQSKIDTFLKYVIIKPIHEKTDDYRLDIWIENGQLKKDLWIKPCIETNKETKKAPIVINSPPTKQKPFNIWPYIVVIIIQAIGLLIMTTLLIIITIKFKRI